MLSSLAVENFTVFKRAELQFEQGLNVIVGENSTGKTHLLKLLYALMAVSAEEGRKGDRAPSDTFLQARIAEKLINIFRPEDAHLGRLARRQQGRNRSEVKIYFSQTETSFGFNFASQNKSKVVMDTVPVQWLANKPVYLPPRELLTIYPGFVSLYETYNTDYEETLRDTCLFLGRLTRRGRRETEVANILDPLEEQIGVVSERNGRFYLKTGIGNMEMPLVAEGWRKLAMLSRLIANGSLMGKDLLLWDEPEANLNPRLIQKVAAAILCICAAGIQVVIATHSLFLLREFETLLKSSKFQHVDRRYFALSHGEDGVCVSEAEEIGRIDPLVSLDEDLLQSDRYLDAMMP